MKLVLASASPRRRSLLEQAGLCFLVDPADVDESLEPGVAASQAAGILALRKARAVAARRGQADVWIIGSDTVVAVGSDGAGWRLLGKPKDAQEAHGMLRELSGTRHRVMTGVAVLRAADGVELCETETTWVSMRALVEAELDAYVATGEWQDKAGGYAIQESADRFVTALEGGGFDNVVGLPVPLTLDLLARLGAPGLPRKEL